jgi:hypothetical protein
MASTMERNKYPSTYEASSRGRAAGAFTGFIANKDEVKEANDENGMDGPLFSILGVLVVATTICSIYVILTLCNDTPENQSIFGLDTH